MGIKNITILGQGNIAWHYNKIMLEKGFTVRCISARKPFASNDMQKDLIIIAVKDSAIEEVTNRILLSNNKEKLKNTILVHTSGFVKTTILQKASEIYGSFYPLQSLKKEDAIDFNTVPLCYWANTNIAKEELRILAKKLSPINYSLTDNQRRTMHIAAVFANNFTNEMFHIAKTLLDKENIPFNVLFPIMERTILSAEQRDPFLNQTGPAIRNDIEIMQEHISKLNEDEKLIYETISNDIIKQHSKA